jgi:sodium--glutamate symport carrier gltS
MLPPLVSGIIVAIGAIVFMGSTNVPLKFPSVQKAKVEPFVFFFYYTIPIFSLSWLVLILEPLGWTWFGMMGSLLWVSQAIIGIGCINAIGMAMGIGLMSGITSNHR